MFPVPQNELRVRHYWPQAGQAACTIEVLPTADLTTPEGLRVLAVALLQAAHHGDHLAQSFKGRRDFEKAAVTCSYPVAQRGGELLTDIWVEADRAVFWFKETQRAAAPVPAAQSAGPQIDLSDTPLELPDDILEFFDADWELDAATPTEQAHSAAPLAGNAEGK